MRDPTGGALAPTTDDRISGKLLIAVVLAVGLAAAGASWWFRYASTHRAANFWGPESTLLIRDAPHVEVLSLLRSRENPLSTQRPEATTSSPAQVSVAATNWHVVTRTNVSDARGLTHLRNALLEDRSFVWSERTPPEDASWPHGLRFQNDISSPTLIVLFADKFDWAFVWRAEEIRSDNPRTVSCQPIAAGLAEVFAEWTAGNPPTESR